jgi:hypothetical protein
MSLALVELDQAGECPPWSGIPIYPGGRLMSVPIHISDERRFEFPGWEHVRMQETKAGDVEYHTYRRIDRVDLPEVPQPLAGLWPADVWGAVPPDAGGASA